MIPRTLVIAIAAFSLSFAAHAQDDKPDEALVQKLLKDPQALAAALNHCDPASRTADPTCLAAQETRRRQFIGTGTVPYTPQPVDPFPTNPTVTPSPRKP